MSTHRPPRSALVRPAIARLISLLGLAVSLGPTPAAARTRVQVPPSLDARPAAAQKTGRTPGVRHPAIHRGRARPGVQLFPRAEDQLRASRARREAMERHPAGKGRLRPCQHEVEPGDTLWDIASKRVQSGPESVAREVGRIYQANQATVGPDPDLILPGQILSLPGDCDR